jgi:serine/threonine protein kinase
MCCCVIIVLYYYRFSILDFIAYLVKMSVEYLILENQRLTEQLQQCKKTGDDADYNDVVSNIYTVPQREARMIQWSERGNVKVLTVEDRFVFLLHPYRKIGCGSFGCAFLGVTRSGTEPLVRGVREYVIKLIPESVSVDTILQEINTQRVVYRSAPGRVPYVYKKLFGVYDDDAGYIRALTGSERYERYQFYISEYRENKPLHRIFREFNPEHESDYTAGILNTIKSVQSFFRKMRDNWTGDLTALENRCCFKHNDLHCGNVLYQTDERGVITDSRIIDFGCAVLSRVYNTPIRHFYEWTNRLDPENDVRFARTLEAFLQLVPRFPGFPRLEYTYDQRVDDLETARRLDEYSSYITDYVYSDFHLFYYSFINVMIASFKNHNEPMFYNLVKDDFLQRYLFLSELRTEDDAIIYKELKIPRKQETGLLFDQTAWLIRSGMLRDEDMYSGTWSPWVHIWRVISLFIEVYIPEASPDLYSRITD